LIGDWKEGNGAGVPAFESTKTPRKISSDFIETAGQRNRTEQNRSTGSGWEYWT
jgi:hypothetical protein